MLSQLTAGTNTYIYRYDGLGNRVAKIVNSVETRYVGGLAETDASGNITAYYVYGFGLISKITPSNESYHYHFDGLGNTIAITDVSGNVVNKYAYDEHGKVLNQEEAIPNPFKYVGQFGVMDEGNGLLYMRARYYDPEVGRFISKDPIGFAGGVNLYGYVANNPVNRVDPGGLIIAQAIGFGVGAAFGAYSAIASGQDTWGVIRSAAVGGLAGALSTIPIPGINPLLSGVIVGGFSGFLGNIGTQYFNPCSKGIDWGSAGLSALAGAGGGLLGSAAGGITSRQGLPVFTKFGQDVISSSVSGIGAGGLDVLLHP